jgi:hypothetical protein
MRGFVIKVLLLSAALSVLIKYGGPLLPIAPSNLNAGIAIAVPPLIMALVLYWRFQKSCEHSGTG